MTTSPSATTSTGTNPTTGAAYPQWEYDLLTGIGASATTANLQALYAWAASEGTTGSNNPLAISGSFAGSTKCIAQCGSKSPIYAYDTIDDGIAATVKFMTGSNSANIVKAFKQNQGLAGIFAAINQSGWCKGCQGGNYPAALSTLVAGGPGTVNPNGTSTGTSSAKDAGTGCEAKGDLINLHFFSITYCEAKALVGGLLTGAGAIVMGLGVALLLGKSVKGYSATTKGAAEPNVAAGQEIETPQMSNARIMAAEEPSAAPSARIYDFPTRPRGRSVGKAERDAGEQPTGTF